jgi:hypothetical protein
MTRTIREIADALGVKEEAARGLVKFLLALAPPLARFRGQRPSGAGKGPGVYEISAGAPRAVAALLGRLE